MCLKENLLFILSKNENALTLETFVLCVVVVASKWCYAHLASVPINGRGH